jgi:hypothetical protein
VPGDEIKYLEERVKKLHHGFSTVISRLQGIADLTGNKP